MKNNRDSVEHEIKKIATQIVYDNEDIDKYADLYSARDKVETDLHNMIVASTSTSNSKKRFFRRPIWQIASVFLLILCLLGAGFQLVRNYIIESKDTHNDFYISQDNFYNLPTYVPANYFAVDTEPTAQKKSSRTLVLHNKESNTFISYTEADSELTVSADNEQVSMESVSIANRYEGTLIHKKEGTVLIWEQEGYFYIITTNDSNISAELLLKIASSIKQAKGVST